MTGDPGSRSWRTCTEAATRTSPARGPGGGPARARGTEGSRISQSSSTVENGSAFATRFQALTPRGTGAAGQAMPAHHGPEDASSGTGPLPISLWSLRSDSSEKGVRSPDPGNPGCRWGLPGVGVSSHPQASLEASCHPRAHCPNPFLPCTSGRELTLPQGRHTARSPCRHTGPLGPGPREPRAGVDSWGASPSRASGLPGHNLNPFLRTHARESAAASPTPPPGSFGLADTEWTPVPQSCPHRTSGFPPVPGPRADLDYRPFTVHSPPVDAGGAGTRPWVACHKLPTLCTWPGWAQTLTSRGSLWGQGPRT